jgi:mono/diheme cytochrome c family protein
MKTAIPLKPRIQTVLLLVASTLAASACGTTSTTDALTRKADIEALTGNSSSGALIYAENCEICHGTDGQSGTISKNITGEGNSGTITIVLAGEGQMPSFSELSDQEIADVAAYVDTL